MNRVFAGEYRRFTLQRESTLHLTHPLARRMAPLQRCALEILALFREERAAVFAELWKISGAPLFFATSMGELDPSLTLAESIFCNSLPLSPAVFQHSVHNATPGYASIVFRSQTPSLTVSSGFLSLDKALLLAFLKVAHGRLPAVIVLAADENTVRNEAVLARSELIIIAGENQVPQLTRSHEIISYQYFGAGRLTPPRPLDIPLIALAEHGTYAPHTALDLDGQSGSFCRRVVSLEGERVESVWRRLP